MWRILGSTKRACDGLTRRDLVRGGSLGLFGLGLADLFRLRSEAGAASKTGGLGSFGQAKACILLYLYGAPSQLETWDLKPDAPSDIRGEFKPIATSVPGLNIGEHLPRMARRMDRASLIRSITHPYNIHSVAYALSGIPTTDIPMELEPSDPRLWPYFGSVIDYLRTRGAAGAASDIPNHVVLPFKFSSNTTPFHRSGPYGGFLGTAFDPVLVEFEGKPLKEGADPYCGIRPGSTFRLTSSGGPGLELSADRMLDRRALLAAVDAQHRSLDGLRPVQGFSRFQALAFNMLRSAKVAQALDLSREPEDSRARYGHSLFGQGVLAARRLTEAGVPLATVFWDEFGDANTAWDTHIDQYSRLKDSLCPGLDAAWSALIDDLERLGRLEETLVIVMSEHGRTPKLNNARGGGREHWSWAYPAIFAGGGVRRGEVVGSTDKVAGYPNERPVSPKDLLATIYHLMGINAATELRDRLDRPVPLVPGGRVISEIVA
jgi:hypothetical protein